MEVEIFTVCDFAQDNGGKLTIVGTFDRITTSAFPCVHASLSVAIRLRFANREEGAHSLMVRLTDAANVNVMEPLEGELNVSSSALGYSAVNLVINFQAVKFEKEGRYSFELHIDGEWQSGLPLFLVIQA